MMQSTTDESLISAFVAGDRKGFDALVKRYYRRVFAFIYRMVRERGLAEDLAQNAFVRLYNKARLFQAGKPFWPWLLRLVRNVVLAELRKSRYNRESLPKSPEIMDNIPSREDSQLKALEKKELHQRMMSLLDTLSEKRRMILIMHFYEDLKYPEIAEAMDCSVGTVKSSVFYALKFLGASFCSQEDHHGLH